MELRQKYIEAKGYDVTDDFMDRFQEINLPLALEIAKHIEKCSIPIPEDLIMLADKVVESNTEKL